eukprot:846310_1
MTPHTMGIEAHLIHNSLGKCYIDGCNQSESNHQRIDREKVNYVFNVHCRRIVELDALAYICTNSTEPYICTNSTELDPKTPSGLERNTKKSVESKSLISGYFVHLLQLK